MNQPAIFISYRRDDSEGFAGWIRLRLAEYFGSDAVFQDITNIPPGRPVGQFLRQAVASCRVVLVLMDKQWLRIADPVSGQRRLDRPDDWVRLEVAAALEHDLIVIPVLLRGTDMPGVHELPDVLKSLADRSAFHIYSHSFETDVQRLAETIEGIGIPRVEGQAPVVEEWPADLPADDHIHDLPTEAGYDEPVWIEGAPPSMSQPAPAGGSSGLLIGLGALLIVGLIVGLVFFSGLFSPGGRAGAPEPEPQAALPADTQPTATPEPTRTPTPNPAFALAEHGVLASRDWPVTADTRNGVAQVLVPAGCFIMGTENGAPDERPSHRVCIAAPFWLDQFEVSNQQYADYLTRVGSGAESAQGRYQAGDDDSLIEWRSGKWRVETGFEDTPVSEVTWHGAREYCEARGNRLPTEAEWEFAARGPDGWRFPWGEIFSGTRAVWDTDQPAPVDSFEDGRSWVGAHHMAGNVWEWVSSLYLPYPYRVDDGREIGDVTGQALLRIARGGSWADTAAEDLRGTFRLDLRPDQALDTLGFRCAADFGD